MIIIVIIIVIIIKFKVKNKEMKVIEDIVLENADTIRNFIDRDQFESWAIAETAANAILAEQAEEVQNE